MFERTRLRAAAASLPRQNLKRFNRRCEAAADGIRWISGAVTLCFRMGQGARTCRAARCLKSK